MSLVNKLQYAFQKAVIRAGGKPELARKCGLAYSIIHRFSSGTCHFGNMTVGTLERLFPELQIDFFGEERHLRAPEDQPAEERCTLLEKQNLELERRLFELEKELWLLKHREPDGH